MTRFLKVLFGLGVTIFIACPVFAAGDLDSVQPADLAPPGYNMTGSPERASGEQLFYLINGGAGLYLSHGFVKCLFSEYEKDNSPVNLQLYQMSSPDGAASLFAAKASTQGQPVEVGQKGFIYDYYLIFYRGPFYAALSTASKGQAERETLREFARYMDQRLKELN